MTDQYQCEFFLTLGKIRLGARVGLGWVGIRCRESKKQMSTTDFDRGRLVSPLRVRHEGDEVKFLIIGVVSIYKRFFAAVL